MWRNESNRTLLFRNLQFQHDKDVSVLTYKPLKKIDSTLFKWPFQFGWTIDRGLVCSYFSLSFQLRTQTVLRCSQLEVKTLCLKAILPVFSQLKAVSVFSPIKRGKTSNVYGLLFLSTHKTVVEWIYVYFDWHPRSFKLLKHFNRDKKGFKMKMYSCLGNGAHNFSKGSVVFLCLWSKSLSLP